MRILPPSEKYCAAVVCIVLPRLKIDVLRSTCGRLRESISDALAVWAISGGVK